MQECDKAFKLCEASLKINPNPYLELDFASMLFEQARLSKALSVINIALDLHTHAPIQIHLFNSMGQELLVRNYIINENDVTVIPIPIQSFSNGLYFIKAIVDGNRYVKSFVIDK